VVTSLAFGRVTVRAPAAGLGQDQDSASTEYGRPTPSGADWAEGWSIIGEEIRKSALARLQATGMFHTTAMRSSALTSWSCGCDSGHRVRYPEHMRSAWLLLT
jgi:hypothetical protein